MGRIEIDAQHLSGGTPALSVDTIPFAPGALGQVLTLNVGTDKNPVFAKYKYMKAGGNITALTPVGPKAHATEGDNTVYADCVSGECIGVATATATTGQYLWVQTRGPLAAVVSSGAIADNAIVCKNVSAAANVITNPAAYDPLAKAIGVALGAAAGNIVTIWLQGTDT
jgi:hypothetical protein